MTATLMWGACYAGLRISDMTGKQVGPIQKYLNLMNYSLGLWCLEFMPSASPCVGLKL